MSTLHLSSICSWWPPLFQTSALDRKRALLYIQYHSLPLLHCDKHQSTPKYTNTHLLGTWTNTVTSERRYRWARGSENLFGWKVEVAGVHSLLKVERRLVVLDRFLHAAHEQEAPGTLSDCMWLRAYGSLSWLSYALASVEDLSECCRSSHDVRPETMTVIC